MSTDSKVEGVTDGMAKLDVKHEEYDVICVGAGFGSVTTLARYVRQAAFLRALLSQRCANPPWSVYESKD